MLTLFGCKAPLGVILPKTRSQCLVSFLGPGPSFVCPGLAGMRTLLRFSETHPPRIFLRDIESAAS